MIFYSEYALWQIRSSIIKEIAAPLDKSSGLSLDEGCSRLALTMMSRQGQKFALISKTLALSSTSNAKDPKVKFFDHDESETTRRFIALAKMARPTSAGLKLAIDLYLSGIKPVFSLTLRSAMIPSRRGWSA